MSQKQQSYLSRRALLCLAVALGLLQSCGYNKTLEIDRGTGYFADLETRADLPDTALVTISKEIDIDSRRALLVVPSNVSAMVVPAKSGFTKRMVKELRYFDEVITIDELRARIEEQGLETDALRKAYRRGGEFLMIQAMADAYKPFLWLRWSHRRSIRGPADEAYQLILTDGYTLEDYFVAETTYQLTSTGPQDKPTQMTYYRNNQYPMLNALITYIGQNSAFYLSHLKPDDEVGPVRDAPGGGDSVRLPGQSADEPAPIIEETIRR